jgi:hypothetical protein
MFSALLILAVVIHFIVFVGLQAVGRVVGEHRLRHEDEASTKGLAVEGSLFALLGLLVAFTFAGGQDRLDARRRLIVDEANAMGTAYLRVDVLPKARQPVVRETFKQYADARIAFYKSLVTDRRVALVQHERAQELQRHLWGEVVAALAEPGPYLGAPTVVLPAFNAMFDVTTSRDVALRTHLPLSVFLLIEILAVACSFLAGLDMGRSNNHRWLHVVLFAGALAVTAYVIMDVEFPRIGVSQVTGADAELVRVRAEM